MLPTNNFIKFVKSHCLSTRKFFVTLKVLQRLYGVLTAMTIDFSCHIWLYLTYKIFTVHKRLFAYKTWLQAEWTQQLIILTINLSLLCKMIFSETIKYIATNNENVITKNTKYVIYRLKVNYSILTLEAFTITTISFNQIFPSL